MTEANSEALYEDQRRQQLLELKLCASLVSFILGTHSFEFCVLIFIYLFAKVGSR